MLTISEAEEILNIVREAIEGVKICLRENQIIQAYKTLESLEMVIEVRRKSLLGKDA